MTGNAVSAARQRAEQAVHALPPGPAKRAALAMLEYMAAQGRLLPALAEDETRQVDPAECRIRRL
jgi:hypothetical protein